MKTNLIDPEKLPLHVAIIMDGNGRWAKERLRNRLLGHEEGINSVREVVRCCCRLGIPYLTLYAFSKENWHRPKAEVDGLWRILKHFLKVELPELIEKGIRLCHMGDPEDIPSDVLDKLQSAVAQTAQGKRLLLNLAINYGGRQEILRAASLLATDISNGKLLPGDISQEIFSRYLFTSRVPDPDLVIRTGGEYRVSNFLLWQIAYAELYVTHVLWPDFREEEFITALQDYAGRERRFGKISEQLNDSPSM